MAPKLNLFQYSIRVFLFTVVLFVPALAFSQSATTGSIEYLKACNGFNGLKLGSDIRELPAYKLSYMDDNSQVDADSCLTYVYQDNNILQVDSDLNLAQIGIRTFKNKIVNIYVFFRINDSYKVLRDFLKNYGQFTELPKEYANIYNWNTQSVALSLKYEAKVELGVAIYTCNDVVKEIDGMKERQRDAARFMQSLASVSTDKDADIENIKTIR